MGKFILICIFLCTGICKTSAQIINLSKFVKSKQTKTEVFSQKLQNMRDSLLRICKIHKLENFEYKFPTLYLGESMESLKSKSKEFKKIKVEIENALTKKELEQKSADSIQKVNDAARIAQEKIADSLYLIRAAQTWEWLHDKKGKWETIDRTYPKEEHYKVNSLFPQYQVIDQNAYLNGVLVGVCDPSKDNKDVEDYYFRQRMMDFLCQQDFLNNKYDIQKESPKTLEYLKRKLGLKKKLDPSDSPVLKEMVSNATKLKIAQEKLRKGEISLEIYQKLKIKLGANTTNYVMQEALESESPEIKAGKRFLKQLCDDNYPLINNYSIKRIDGTNFIYLFSNSKGEETLNVQVSFYVNKEGEVEYKISLPLNNNTHGKE